jgi:hypothetical protein
MVRFGRNDVALAFAVRRVRPGWPDRMCTDELITRAYARQCVHPVCIVQVDKSGPSLARNGCVFFVDPSRFRITQSGGWFARTVVA